MSGSNHKTAPVRRDETLERIKMHIIIVAVLNIMAAAFYLMSASMILYNLYFTDFTSEIRDFTIAICIGMAVLSVPCLLVGIGLLLRIRLARFAAILLGFVHLLEIPVGTPIGVYTLWLFLSQDTDKFFGKDAAPHLTLYPEEEE